MREFYKEYEHTKMRFGKYKGYYLKDIPVDYIKWATMNISDRASAEMFKIELLNREKKLR